MNVSVAGYLQLANALLCLAMGISVITRGADADGYRVTLGIFAFAIYANAVGMGLLKRRNWARWLMLGPGLAGPLTAVAGAGILALGVFMGAMALNSARGWFVGWSAWQGPAGFWIWLLAVSMIASGIVNFRLFGYLLSEPGREEFNSQEKRHVGATLLSLAVAGVTVFVALAGTVRVPREHIPEVLRSPAMRSADSAIEAEILQALPRAASNVVFSADSRRLVIAPETGLLGLVVIELDSGVARRPKLQSAPMFRSAAQLWGAMAPDASSLLSGTQWISLQSGAATEFRELLQIDTERLGFHTPTRLLIRDRRQDALQLLDLPARRVVFSVPASIGPYDFPGLLEQKYNDPPAGWSRSRDRFAWSDANGGISTLTMDSGEVRSAACAGCQPGRRLRLADDGGKAMLAIPGNSSHAYQWRAHLVSPQGENVQLADFHGELVYFSSAGDEPWALLSESGRHVLVFRELVNGASWEAGLGDGVMLQAVTANRDLLIREAGRGAPDRFWLAHFEPPPEHTQLALREIRLTLADSYFRTASPDGRFLAFASLDGRLELLDLRSLREGSFDSHTLDVRAGTQLQATRTVPATERRTLSWIEPEKARKQSAPKEPLEGATYDSLL